MTTRFRTTVHTLATAALLGTPALHAQQDTTLRIDEHWRAYLGCWATSSAGAPGPMVCVVPTAEAQTVEFVTVVGDSVVNRTPVTASGARVPRTGDGCAGWDSGRWSLDERRLYLHAEVTCKDAAAQQVDGILAMRNANEFARIDGVKTKGGTRTRIVRFTLLTDSAIQPAKLRARIPSPMLLPSFSARMEASDDVALADVIEAAKEFDAPLVEAWLGERGQRFVVGVGDLRDLRSAKVSEGVIDMVVALSNPRYFAVSQGGPPAVRTDDPFARRGLRNPWTTPAQMQGLALSDQCLDFAYRGYAPCTAGLMTWNDLYFPWSGYPLYRGFDRFSNQVGPYGPIFGNAWNGGFGPIYGGGYVIVPSGQRPADPPGRVINGRGYSQGGAGGGSTAEPRSPAYAPSPTVNSSEIGSSSGNSGAGSTGASQPASSTGGEQRTAKPRP